MEGHRGVLRLVLVEEDEATLATLLAVLPLDAVRPLDVHVVVVLHVAELVCVLGRVDDPGLVLGPHGELLQLAVEHQDHLAAEAVVDVERLLAVVVFFPVSGVRAHDAPRNHFRHVDFEKKKNPNVRNKHELPSPNAGETLLVNTDETRGTSGSGVRRLLSPVWKRRRHQIRLGKRIFPFRVCVHTS